MFASFLSTIYSINATSSCAGFMREWKHEKKGIGLSWKGKSLVLCLHKGKILSLLHVCSLLAHSNPGKQCWILSVKTCEKVETSHAHVSIIALPETVADLTTQRFSLQLVSCTGFSPSCASQVLQPGAGRRWHCPSQAGGSLWTDRVAAVLRAGRESIEMRLQKEAKGWQKEELGHLGTGAQPRWERPRWSNSRADFWAALWMFWSLDYHNGDSAFCLNPQAPLWGVHGRI